VNRRVWAISSTEELSRTTSSATGGTRDHMPISPEFLPGELHYIIPLAETTWPVYGLLCLFRQLGRLGIPPFNDGVIRPHA
jgi:hypothetical protein